MFQIGTFPSAQPVLRYDVTRKMYLSSSFARMRQLPGFCLALQAGTVNGDLQPSAGFKLSNKLIHWTDSFRLMT